MLRRVKIQFPALHPRMAYDFHFAALLRLQSILIARFGCEYADTFANVANRPRACDNVKDNHVFGVLAETGNIHEVMPDNLLAAASGLLQSGADG
jgi:hypothetical protein